MASNTNSFMASTTTGKRKRRRQLQLLDITNTSIVSGPKRACASKAEVLIKDQSKQMASRGRHVTKSPSPAGDELPPAGQPVLRERSMPNPPQPPSDLVTLHGIVKGSPHALQQGMQTLQSYTERNTTFVIQKAVTLQVFSACVCSGMAILEACSVAATSMGFSAQVVRRWAKDIYADFFVPLTSVEDVTDDRLERELESGRGKNLKWISLISDESLRSDLRKFVAENGYVKGRPNLTLQDVVTWLKDTRDVEVCKSTVSVWLHEMGFSYRQFSKGVYFDGHEREDVVADRRVYLHTLQSFERRLWTYNSPAPNPAIRPLIEVFHDESTFYANADQSFHWTDGNKQVLKQKSLGQAIMVSDFVEEVGGMLEFEGEKASFLLEHQTEGYFTNDLLISQASLKAINNNTYNFTA